MVLKLKRRVETFEAYQVYSGSFLIGHIQRVSHAPVETWVWGIGNVYISGNPQGGAGDREEAMRMLGDRWRSWLAAAALREIEPGRDIGCETSPVLSLEYREGGPSEGYRIMSGRALVGHVGRTHGVRNDQWYWQMSIYNSEDGSGRPIGGGDTRDEAMATFAARWREWLATAGLAAP